MVSQNLFDALQWRLLGPYRGGRVMAVVGHPHDPQRFYFGTSSGGVWQTDDGGATWRNISDGFFRRASVGALAIADADPNVIYVGMGECGLRNNVTHGDGVYRSTNGGRSWAHRGLAHTHNIARIRIHPHNPDLVYVAAFGHRFGTNAERGVYRSRDGGATWEQVLFIGDHVGAIDLTMDGTNPRVLYAAFWEAQLFPWGRKDRGAGSGIYCSTDGGDTWAALTLNSGLPHEQQLGKIGLCASPLRAGRVWAQIDADAGGIYRSDDHGDTWTWLNDDRNFIVRAWYFSHLTPDPHDPDGVYIVTRKLWHSRDAGRTYRQINTPYVDQHDLWVDPRDPRRMIVGNDGGAAVSFNSGETWSSIVNQPTGEIYRVATDTHFPYRVYGSQQDNSTICLPSRSDVGPIGQFDWYDVGGGESGYIAVRPDDPNIVYASDLPSLGVTRYDHRTRQLREIAPWLGTEPPGEGLHSYRFNWSTPVVLSPHDPDVLYIAGNVLFRSSDEGHSWEAISPDLTRNDQHVLHLLDESPTGEYALVNDYCTISSFGESLVKRGVLWVGTDDGLVQLSRDDGATWASVTPPDLPAWATTHVEPSAHAPGCAYVAATLHQRDDFRPYAWKSSDYGQTWHAITTGIPQNEFIRVVREDPARHGLLYAGTEAGVYVSLDDGAHWQSLQTNLPIVAVHDLAVKEGDLVVGTHGRGMWVLDDLSPLHQLADETLATPVHLFAPRPAYRLTRQAHQLNSLLTLYDPFVAANPSAGVTVTFFVRELPSDPVTVALLDATGTIVSNVSSDVSPLPAVPLGPPEYELRGGAATLTRKAANENEPGVLWGARTLPPADGTGVTLRAGLNRVTLDLRCPGATLVPGTLVGGITAPLAPPGTYTVRLTVGDQQWTQLVALRADPRLDVSQEELEAQFQLMLGIRQKVSDVHVAVRQIRIIRQQVADGLRLANAHSRAAELGVLATQLSARLDLIEDALIQRQISDRSGELDGFHLPPRLDQKLQALGYAVARSDSAPTRQSVERFAELAAQVETQLAALESVRATGVAAFNALFRELGVLVVSG